MSFLCTHTYQITITTATTTATTTIKCLQEDKKSMYTSFSDSDTYKK